MVKKIILAGVGAGIVIGASYAGFFVLKRSQPATPIVIQGCSAQCATISSMVVPHHDLVKAQRRELFTHIGKMIGEPKTVILISPNHYGAGKATVQTTNQTWQIDEGTIEPDISVLSSIIDHGASMEPASFINEHGIYLILNDIKRTFPNARIVPIIFKIDTPSTNVQKLHDALKKSCDQCLVVASVDFSHYQPAVLANEHDQLSIRALKNLDEDAIREKAEVDSPPSLQFLIAWARSHNTERFELANHTNSGELLSNPDIETTTHLFGYYTEGERIAPERRVSFFIGGDMMFARGIHATFEKDLKESVAHLGDRLFWGTDVALSNLEGAISSTRVKPDPGPTFKFVFPPETVSVLKYMHINAVSLANNHSINAGSGGEEVTRQLLSKQNIQAIGGWSGVDTVRTATFSGQGLKLTIIGVHMLLDIPDIKDQISKIKSDPDQRVIIFPHWGVEYEPRHSAQQERLARAWIDAGADMVIGSHPHVIQDAEIYRGKPIIYSLGNLLFDQDWSVPTQQGMLIGGAFTDKGVELFGLPVVSKNHQPELARGALKQNLLQKLWSSITPSDIIKILN